MVDRCSRLPRLLQALRCTGLVSSGNNVICRTCGLKAMGTREERLPYDMKGTFNELTFNLDN